VLDEGSLHGVQIARLTDTLNGGDLIALMHQGEGEAAVYAPSVYMDSTGAALTVIAAFFCAGKVNALTQRIEQGCARVEILQRVILAVDAKGDGAAFGAIGLLLYCCFGNRRCGGERSRSGNEAGGAETSARRFPDILEDL